MANKKNIKADKNLYKRGDTYYLRYTVNGELLRQSLKTTIKSVAEKKKKDILKTVKDIKTEICVIEKVGRAKRLSSKESIPLLESEHNSAWNLFEQYLLRQKTTTATSLKSNRTHTRQFVDWCKDEQRLTCLNDIADDIAIKYSIYLNKLKYAGKTFNEKISVIFRLFYALSEKTGLAENPFREKNIPRRNKDTISKKELTKKETLKILDSFNTTRKKELDDFKEVELLFYFGAYTGMRLKDCCLLEWNNVDFDTNNIINVTLNKTKRFNTVVDIPLLPELADKLRPAYNNRTDSNYVLPALAGRYKANRENICKITTKIFIRNGFECSVENSDRIKSTSQYNFHSLRYAYISTAAENGIPLSVVQSIVGHLTTEQTKQYTRISKRYKQSSMAGFSYSNKSNSKVDIADQLKNADPETLKKIQQLLEAGV